jgi:hypothetical protein
MMPLTDDPAVIEHRLLDLAYTTDLAITVPTLAYYAPCAIDDAERVLDRLVADGRLRMDVDDDGNVSYALPNRQKIARPAPPTAITRRREALPVHTRGPNPLVAGALSLIIPGAGQLYLGKPVTAIAWFAVVTLGYLLMIVPGLILHMACIASATAGAFRPYHPHTRV